MGALDTTIGAVEIGISISSCLYGIMAVQAYNYYQANFKSDGLVIKSLVSSDSHEFLRLSDLPIPGRLGLVITLYFLHNLPCSANFLCSIIETIHTAFLWTYLYYFSVTNFGDVPKLAVAHWSLGFSVPVANFVTCTVQVRLMLLSQYLIWPC